MDKDAEIARLENELDQANLRYNLILEASNDGVWDWNLLTDTCFFSTRWKALLGYEPHEVEDNSTAFFDLIRSQDQPRVQAAVQAHLDHESSYDVEFRMRANDGSFRIIRARGQAVWDEDGKPVRMAGTHTDVTNQRREAQARVKEQALIEAQRATIQALGTPVLELGDNVLCVPIIGSVDRERAERMTSELLSQVAEAGARFVIADLTAAELAGEDTLAHLVRLFRSVALIGAQGAICGVSPALAQQMVRLQLSFDSIPVYRNLGEALRASGQT